MRHAVLHLGSDVSVPDSGWLPSNPKPPISRLTCTIRDRGKVNWSRVVSCGLLAGVVWIILGSVVTALLGRQFAALPNNRLGTPTLGFVLFNILLDLLEGISILWLYAAIRPVYRPARRRQ